MVLTTLRRPPPPPPLLPPPPPPLVSLGLVLKEFSVLFCVSLLGVVKAFSALFWLSLLLAGVVKLPSLLLLLGLEALLIVPPPTSALMAISALTGAALDAKMTP